MAYTSVLPVHRLDRSIEYVKDRAKTTKSAGSLEEAIDYALNREKTEQTIFEDAIGCTCENAYVDMVKTKERFHKKKGYRDTIWYRVLRKGKYLRNWPISLDRNWQSSF